MYKSPQKFVIFLSRQNVEGMHRIINQTSTASFSTQSKFSLRQMSHWLRRDESFARSLILTDVLFPVSKKLSSCAMILMKSNLSVKFSL